MKPSISLHLLPARSRAGLARNVLASAVLFAIAGAASAVQMGGASPRPLAAPPPSAVGNVPSAMPVPSLATATAGQPSGGVVAAGQAQISTVGDYTTISQSTQNVVINWQSFSIDAGQTVQFVQPGSSSIALNRVLGSDPSQIFGTLLANGQVFILNPNGVLFGKGASVNVGGLVASTMRMSDADFLAGQYRFTDAGAGSVVNEGSITARDGGPVVLMGRTVRNDGAISARLGSVALVGAQAATLDLAGDGLLSVSVDQGALNALVENGGLIQADGGRVLLSAGSAGDLLDTVVNNTGVIQARTIENRAGTILLLGDMQTGTVTVGGLLDASAPQGGNGGFIETSAANVLIADGARVDTSAAGGGATGLWLIDPQDFTIGSSDGDNISGSTLSAQLVTTNVTITTASIGNDPGDIFVNDAVSWSASGAPTTLTLIANNDVNINAPVTATNGNFAVCCSRDINVNAAITTTNGSVLLSAGRDINQFGAITVTDGNLMMCAADDVFISGKITLTRGTNDPTRSLGLPIGLTLSADTDGTGPGIEGGTVIFAPLAPPVTVTKAPVTIFYNPVSYTSQTDYSTKFVLTEGAALKQYMLVFADGGSKEADGTTDASLEGLIGDPEGVTLVAGPNAEATYETGAVGEGQTITYTGYTLEGPNAGLYAFAMNCCGKPVAHTTGTITAASTPPPPPPTTPPPTTPPPTTPPPTPPPVVPPPVVPPVVPPGEVPPTLPIDYPTIGTTPPGMTPIAVAWVPAESSSPLLSVTEAPLPPTLMTTTPVVEEELPEEVQPVLVRKAYRN